MVIMRTLATHLFLPHQSNNQRPKLLHPQTVIIYVLLFFVLQLGFRIGKFVYPEILGVATNITTERLLFLTNQKREEHGLSSLSLNSSLSTAALQKAQDMFSKNYWAHIAPDGTTPWQFIQGSGYVYLFAGENLAKDFNDSEGVVSAWMASATHRDNILKEEYADIGFAVLNGKLNSEETTLVVQMFGKGKASLASRPPLIPAKAAIAQSSPSAPSLPSPTLAPTAIPTPTSVLVQVPPIMASSSLQAATGKRALIDILNLERSLSLGLLVVLLIVLSADGILVLKRKTVRIVGHNIAHIIFLGTLITLIFLTKRGAVL